MQGFPQSIPPLDLTRYSETTRRRLYDSLQETHFFYPGHDPDHDTLPYTAEDAGLSVLFVYGRWVAVWTRLEVESFRPEADRIEVLFIKPTTENALGVMLYGG